MSKICFVCPDNPAAAGGIKQIYRQAQALASDGKVAVIVHGSPSFGIDWFAHSAQVFWHPEVARLGKSKSRWTSRLKQVVTPSKKAKASKRNNPLLVLQANDIVVLPEFYGIHLNKAFEGQRVVIYNQNCYYSFRGYSIDNSSASFNSIYNQERLLGVIVASQDATTYLELMLPNKPVKRVFYGMDSKVFSYQKDKKRQIAFMPRKLKEDLTQVVNIAKLTGIAQDWNWVAIDGMDEQQVAKVLKDSAIFLSFNHREGFGMPPAEAMNCGCVVVGYAGQGGAEYLLESFSFPVAQRNIQMFVKQLQQAVALFENHPNNFLNKGKAAADFIQTHYSMERETQSILKAWNDLL